MERWNPPYCGEIDMRIAADGTWFYRGSPIGREALVRLFASILRREPDGRHVLVTPVEKVGIAVEDAPFLAVEVAAEGEGAERVLTFRTNVGDIVAAGPEHPLALRDRGRDGRAEALPHGARRTGGACHARARARARRDRRREGRRAGPLVGRHVLRLSRGRSLAEPRPYSAEDFRRRVGERLHPIAASAVGDHSFNPEIADMLLKIERRPAAVLVPVIHREPEATLLFTERTGGLRVACRADRLSRRPHRSGGCRPGGGGAARGAGGDRPRRRNSSRRSGAAPDYLTGSGYHVALVVAVVRPGFALTLNPAEVADAFEVPLSFLMDPANHRSGSRIWNGAARTFFEMPFENRHIWGITAGIVRILYERLYADPSARRGGMKALLRDWPLLREPHVRAVLCRARRRRAARRASSAARCAMRCSAAR